MFTTRSLAIGNINSYFQCQLCNGYLIDCLKIDECLHNFCKSCILYWLRKSTSCPVCGIEINSIKPWVNLRADISLQNMIYKLIPSLVEEEEKRQCKFNCETDHFTELSADVRSIENEQIKGQELICFVLRPDTNLDSKRIDQIDESKLPAIYVQCSSIIPAKVIAKYVRLKLCLPMKTNITIMAVTRNGFKIAIPESLVLADVAQTICWTGMEPLPLYFAINGDIKSLLDQIQWNNFTVIALNKQTEKANPVQCKTECTDNTVHDDLSSAAILHTLSSTKYYNSDKSSTPQRLDYLSSGQTNASFNEVHNSAINSDFNKIVDDSIWKSSNHSAFPSKPLFVQSKADSFPWVDGNESSNSKFQSSNGNLRVAKVPKQVSPSADQMMYYYVPTMSVNSNMKNTSATGVLGDHSLRFPSAGMHVNQQLGAVGLQPAPAFVPIVINSNCIENHYHHQNVFSNERQQGRSPMSNSSYPNISGTCRFYQKRKSSKMTNLNQRLTDSKIQQNIPVKRYLEIRPKLTSNSSAKQCDYKQLQPAQIRPVQANIQILSATRFKVRRQRTLSEVLSHRITFEERNAHRSLQTLDTQAIELICRKVLSSLIEQVQLKCIAHYSNGCSSKM